MRKWVEEERGEEAAKSGTHSTIRWAHNDRGTQQHSDSGHKWHTTIVGTSGTHMDRERGCSAWMRQEAVLTVNSSS